MKKNIIIAVLCIIIVGLLTYIVYDKINSNNSDSNVNSNGIKQNYNTINSNSNSNTSKQENVSAEEVFNSFVKKQNLTTSNNIFDSDSLKQMNCENAVSANGNDYSLEMLTFKDVDSAKSEYQNQKNYQISTNKQKELLSSVNNNSYDIYEATMAPDLVNAPAANGDEVYYILYLRKDNYLIMLYQSSTNADKTTYINLGKELKEMLNIK